MKYFYLIIFTLIFIVNVNSQNVDYKDRANKNLELLIKNDAVAKQVVISDKGIDMFSLPGSHRPEFTLYWSEVSEFLRRFHQYDYHQMVEFYINKGTNPLFLHPDERKSEYVRYFPTQMSDLVIAIDPGHFAGNWEEAMQEKKYIKIKGEKLGLENDITFYEADLTYATAYVLKSMLEDAGAQAILTRGKGASAVGKPFDQWYKDDFKKDVKRLVDTGELDNKIARKLLNKPTEWGAFYNVYKYLDFVNRAKIINTIKPDLSLVIHYNANETSRRQSQRYWDPTDTNYSMAFVPGAFMNGELASLDSRIEFLRLLVSPDLEESIAMADILINEHSQSLGVPPLPKNAESDLLATSCIKTAYDGVFSRNLFMTRAIESPVVYCESLYQDNKTEVINIGKKDTKYGEINTSMRVIQVAKTYYNSILKWLEYNKEAGNLSFQNN